MKKPTFLILSVMLLLLCSLSIVFAHRTAESAKNVAQRRGKELFQNHALVVAHYSGWGFATYDDNGLIPIFKHLENDNFENSFVFDKVTGKASALLLAYGKAENLHTGLLSREAIPVLEKHNIKYTADKTVDYIINRRGDDRCPMEKTVAGIDDPQEAYETLTRLFYSAGKE